MTVAFPCLYCGKPVDPTGRDAAMHPVSKQWHHKGCGNPTVEAKRGTNQDDRAPRSADL